MEYMKLLSISILILVLVTSVYSLEANIEVKNAFQEGETLTFDYSIISDKDMAIRYYACLGDRKAASLHSTSARVKPFGLTRK